MAVREQAAFGASPRNNPLQNVAATMASKPPAAIAPHFIFLFIGPPSITVKSATLRPCGFCVTLPNAASTSSRGIRLWWRQCLVSSRVPRGVRLLKIVPAFGYKWSPQWWQAHAFQSEPVKAVLTTPHFPQMWRSPNGTSLTCSRHVASSGKRLKDSRTVDLFVRLRPCMQYVIQRYCRTECIHEFQKSDGRIALQR
jgi:hypothetical protein